MTADPNSHLRLGELETRKLVGIVDALRLFEPRIKLLEGGTVIFLHINDRADELDAIERAPDERKRRIAEHIEMRVRIGNRRIELRRRDKPAAYRAQTGQGPQEAGSPQRNRRAGRFDYSREKSIASTSNRG